VNYLQTLLPVVGDLKPVIDEFPHRTVAAGEIADEMSPLFDFGVSVRRASSQPYSLEQWQVEKVIPHIRGFFGTQVVLLTDGLEDGQFLDAPEVDFIQLQVLATQQARLRRPAADDTRLEPKALAPEQSEPIPNTETLGFNTLVIQVDRTVCQDAIQVEKQQADADQPPADIFRQVGQLRMVLL
jgi:hypothetical protein